MYDSDDAVVTIHPRKAIRGLFKDKLTGTGPSWATAAQDRVYDTMTPPIDIESTIAAEGPVLMVYCREEDMREEDYPVSRFDGAVRRRLKVDIEVIATGVNVDDFLDDVAAQIEALIEPWDIPGFENADVLLISTNIDVAAAQERIVGGIFMIYHVKYWAPYRPDTTPAFIPDEVSVRPRDGVDPDVVSEFIIDDDASPPVRP